MSDQRWTNFFYNVCIGLNGLLLFLVFMGTEIRVPVFLQVMGRMHPLLLHFPIVLFFLTAFSEVFVQKRNPSLFHPIGNTLLLSTAVVSAMSALMGLILSQESGYESGALFWHKWSGVALSSLAWAWYAFRDLIRGKHLFSTAVASCAVIITLVAGHEGASITHGKNYLSAPLSEEKASGVDLENALVFEHLVRPILEEKCMGCHNNTKSKGDLIMVTEVALLKGGEHGKLWDQNGQGLLLERIHLPLESEEHMPPKGKPQLTAQEIIIISQWLSKGADFKQKIKDLPQTDSLRILAEPLFNRKAVAQYNFDPADEATIKKLNNDYRAVFPLAIHSPALVVEFFGIAAFKSEHLKELTPISDQIVDLNLSRMPITDDDLKIIAGFANLRKLNLANTPISGINLPALQALKHLEKLTLSGTNIKANDLEKLPNLSHLYVWNTAINENDLSALRSKMPHTKIETGYQGANVVAKLNAAIIEGDKQVFTDQTKVKLKNYIKGAEIRYTLDGSIPDSLRSSICDSDSLSIDKTCMLTTKVFLPGWISSDVSIRHFYKVEFIPDSAILVHQPNPQYKGEGAKTLFNSKVGDTEFRNNKWLGYRETPMETYLLFKKPIKASSVSISTLVDIGSYIMPAASIEIWGGMNKNKLTLLKKIKPDQPKAVGMPGYKIGINAEFAAQNLSVLKVIVKPVPKLPLWHPGKGDPAWVFMDEIFVN